MRRGGCGFLITRNINLRAFKNEKIGGAKFPFRHKVPSMKNLGTYLGDLDDLKVVISSTPWRGSWLLKLKPWRI